MKVLISCYAASLIKTSSVDAMLRPRFSDNSFSLASANSDRENEVLFFFAML